MASLDILCFNSFNLKNKITKIEHKKIFCGPSNILKNFLIIDKFSMVSSHLWVYLDSRSDELFIMIPERAFAGFSIMTVCGFLQLPPVKQKFLTF